MSTTVVRDIMTHTPLIISPEKTVEDAAKIMKDENCGVLPVGTLEHARGILTDRDIVLRVIAEGKNPQKILVGEVMTSGLYTCDINTTLDEAAEKMREYNVCRLVVTREGRTNGIITLACLLRHAGSQKISDEVLHTLLGSRRKKHVSVGGTEAA